MYDWRKWRFDNVLTGVIGGILLGIVIAAIFNTVFHLQPSVYLITAGGAFGGWLYGMRGQRLIMPKKRADGDFDPGWIADCAFGIAGGYVIFLLVPGTFDAPTGAESWPVVKVIAAAVIGGYAGRALFDRAPRREDSVVVLETTQEPRVKQKA